ncbi:MAG: hypothetical protein VB024_09010 [Dysgonamonadaceae bacterium]|nr:hypothetical protein [Dysgonamonadaceae bacterium]
MRNFIYFYLILLLLSVASACTTVLDIKEMDKTVELNSTLALPLGQTTLRVSDLFSEEFGSNFKVDNKENYVYLNWHDTLEYVVTNELADFSKGKQLESSFIDDSRTKIFPKSGSKQINKTLADNINKLLQSGDNYMIDYDYNFNRVENGELTQRVDSLHVNSLLLNLDITLKDFSGISPNDSWIRLDISSPYIPELKEQSILIKSNTQKETIRLHDFILPFNGEETILPISLKFTLIIPEGKIITVHSTSDITTKILVDEIDVNKAWGYFNYSGNLLDKSFDIDIPDEILRNIDFQNNKLLFHDPMVFLDIESNIGIPLQVVIDQIIASDAKGKEVNAIFKGNKSYIIDLKKPDEGTSQITRTEFNRENGSTNLLFTIIPEKISCSFHANVNHEAAKIDQAHHLSFPIKFNIPVEFKLPFQFDPGTSYTYNDTIKDADFSKLIEDIAGSSGDIDLTDLKVTLNIENSLPVNALAKATFLDNNGKTIHIEDNIVIPAPNVDTQGRSVDISEQTIILSAGSTIKDTKQIILNINISGGKEKTNMIFFRDNDYLKATVGLYLKGIYQTDLESF